MNRPFPGLRRVVVAGLGNEYRRDDGAGALVASRVAGHAGGVIDIGPLVDPLDLLGLWDGADLAIVVDAVRSGAQPGTIQLVELAPDDSPTATSRAGPGSAGPGSPRTSTHGIGLAGVLRLARAVGQAPARVIVVCIEGDDFGQGTGLTPGVAAAIPHAARHVIELIEEAQVCA
jgi:hydrogenase maturation protease